MKNVIVDDCINDTKVAHICNQQNAKDYLERMHRIRENHKREIIDNLKIASLFFVALTVVVIVILYTWGWIKW